MSFLDDQASGQIGIGERADLGTLTRTRRKRKRGQRPQGTETYSLLPQNEFTDIVSSPTDIQQVGIGNLLTAQGASAADVQNVFERYKTTGAAPIGELGDVLYPQPEDDGDDDDDDDDDLVTGSDPVDISPSSNIYDLATQTGIDFKAQSDAAEQASAYEASVLGGAGTGRTSLPALQAAKAAIAAAKHSATGGKQGRTYNQSVLNYAINLDVNEDVDLETPEGSKNAAAMFGITIDEGSGAATGPAGINVSGANVTGYTPGAGGGGGSAGSSGSGIAAVSRSGGSAFPGSNPSVSAGMFGEPSDPSIPDPPSVSDQSGAGDTSGPDFFASGGTVKAKNKNSFMSMKGK